MLGCGHRVRETDDKPYTAILAADNSRPMSEYVPSVEYVYAKAFGYRATHPHVAVARQGRGHDVAVVLALGPDP